MKHFNHGNVRKIMAGCAAFVAMIGLLAMLGDRSLVALLNLGIWLGLFFALAGFFDKTPPEFIARATLRSAWQEHLNGDSSDWDQIMTELMEGIKRSFLEEIWNHETSHSHDPTDRDVDAAA